MRRDCDFINREIGAIGEGSSSLPAFRVSRLSRGLITFVTFVSFCWIQQLQANPVGPTVTQGKVSFSSQGSHLTIQTSDRAFINWQSFNIGVGQTTTFVQPSSSSLVWNQINDPNPSQILGNLNANGYVVLQNQAGFYIGGLASITAHGFLMTTAPVPMPDLASGGAWQFNAPPPTAEIINYGQISSDHGGSIFLLAHNIQNHGTISAPGGDIGLYAGKDVLVSERADGRGLSAKVTLPEGSVDNSGKLIADAGSIALHAQVVNQGGLLQANSVREVNGKIELVASDAINLGPASSITAKGDATATSSGGSVLIKSASAFADTATSLIDVSGGYAGGNGGQVEISAAKMSSIKSNIEGTAAPGFLGGKLFIDPDNIRLTDSGDPAPGSGTVNQGDPPSAGSPDTLTLDVNSFSPSLSQIKLQATHDIELSTVWSLSDSTDPGASLTLQAGRNITLDDGSAILAGRNWKLNIIAGTELTSAAAKNAGRDGIYLQGSAHVQSQNGDINVTAGNEIILDDGIASGLPVAGNGITTKAGGNITATATYGDVNTGGNPFGYTFGVRTAPYYKISPSLGGISTAAGGNVTITAGGDVTSYLPLQGDPNAIFDGGCGAFGPQAGNVSITAAGNVYGHYVVANGVGTIAALGDIGAPITSQGTALSLAKGSWSLSAPNGSIFLQEVRNPNGMFNDRGNASSNPGYHLFDYDALSSVSLQAGNSVEITGLGIPRIALDEGIIFPPTLQVIAGAGGFLLDSSMSLFPSPSGNLTVATLNGGDFRGVPDPANGSYPTLAMSDSGSRQWTAKSSFGVSDHGANPTELNNPDPVVIGVSGNLKTVNLSTTKQTQITVGGDVINASLIGENLHEKDVTFVNVAGKIFNTPGYAFDYLTAPIIGADPLNPSDWTSIFALAVDPRLALETPFSPVDTINDLKQAAASMQLFPGTARGNTLGFVYDPTTLRLGFRGPMPFSLRAGLEGPLEIIKVDQFGTPVLQPGQKSLGQDPNKFYFATTPVTFAPTAVIDALYLASQEIPQVTLPGFQIGGPGKFNITASSIELGNTYGILSWGIGGSSEDSSRYASVAKLTRAGADIDVEVTGDLSMLTSTIASMYGGNVVVNSTGGEIDLGSQELFGTGRFAFGIYTSGHSDVSVTAAKNINIEGSRIAAYNGGNVFVESLEGNVNAGSGGNVYVNVPLESKDPVTGQARSSLDQIYGSGVVATSLPKDLQTPGGNPLPGNITIETPRGDILSTSAGILQLALDGSVAGGPSVTLVAGTKPENGSPGHDGNIDLGDSGVIGGTVNLTAQGNIKGLVVSRQSSTINAAQNFSGTLLSAGTANVSAGGTVSGTIIGVGGVSASAGKIDATLLSQNVSVGGGQAQSTLGNSATATSASQSAAGQASSYAKEKIAGDGSKDDDEEKKRKLAARPALMRKVGRVTVILPPS